jgi:hypothetical protein
MHFLLGEEAGSSTVPESQAGSSTVLGDEAVALTVPREEPT